MTAVADLADVAQTMTTHRSTLDETGVRGIYDRLVSLFEKLCHLPTHVTVTTSKHHGTARAFPRARKWIDALDWSDVTSFGISFVRPDRDLRNRGYFDWSIQGSAGKIVSVLSPDPRWNVQLSVFLTDVEIDDQLATCSMLKLGQHIVEDYGYMFYMRRISAPPSYVVGLGVSGCGRTDDEANNVGAWAHHPEHYKQFLLRDVYPWNLLTQPYLHLPVEGTTLEKWIKTDESRGTLEPLTDKVTTWRPVPQNIPQIREALFRAGIMFYWRFFDQFDPMFRDFAKPWKPPDTIPEMFRAEFYKGQDPQITR